MKNRVTLLISLLLSAFSFAQKTWIGPSSGGNWATAANWSGNAVPATNDVVTFPSSMSGTISNINAGNNITLGGLIIGRNSNLIFTNTSNKTITIANGPGSIDFLIETGARLQLDNNVDLTLASGTTTNHTTGSILGTLIVGANRTFDTNNGNVTTTVDGTIQNQGTTTGNTARLIFDDGSFYVHDRAGGNIPSATWNTSSTCLINGITGSDPGNDNQAFGNLIYDCPNMTGTRNLGGGSISVSGNLEIRNTGTAVLKQAATLFSVGGDFILSGGTMRIGDNTSRVLSVAGSVTISGGTLQMSTGNNAADLGTLNVGGNFSQSGGLITETSSGRGAINFTGTSVQYFSKSLTAIISNNIDFTVSNGSKLNLGTSALNGSTGSFTLQDNAKIITGNPVGLYSTGSLGSIQVTGTRTYSSNADYEFCGASTGVFTTTSNPSIRNMTVNFPGGIVLMAQPMLVNGSLILTDGLLTTTAVNLLTLASSATSTVAKINSFVNGPLAKIFSAPLSGFTFPVGKAGAGYRNISITAPSGTATFQAEFFRAAPPAGILGTDLTQISACEYWNLSRTAGASGVSTRVVLSWESNSICNAHSYITQPNSLRVAHFSGGTWINEGYLTSTGNPSAGTITSGNLLTSFSPFTLAGVDPGENPLPVSIGDLKGFEKVNGVQVEWSNYTEKEVVHYAIERSSNGKDFMGIGLINPSSNNNEKQDYTFLDANPLKGRNYYRIRTTDLSGRLNYSRIIVVDLENTKPLVGLFPNPVLGKEFSISLTGLRKGQYILRVVNQTGQILKQEDLRIIGSSHTQTVTLPAGISGGIYSLVITGNDYQQNKSFIVR